MNQTGILLGVTIRVAEQTISGPVVVVLNDSRLAIGTEIAKELKVVLGERNAS
ncbi:FeoA domain-containing protein [Turicimonas muris]|uniref:FeoA domain-containing protein n=1 Tax=Turicimonas muris TaxID=1796652 RepID=UPI0026DEF295|nr:FeoA domain-containing protein [Turicimonas muris]